MHDPSVIPPRPILLAGQDQERTDSLPAANAFATSPFFDIRLPQPEPEPATDDTRLLNARRLEQLARLRRRPGYALLADSVLLLRSLQLDMDAPAAWPRYVRKRLTDWLHEIAGKPLAPDTLRLRIESPHSGVDPEQQSLELNLSQLAVRAGDRSELPHLARAKVIDDAPLAELPSFKRSDLLRNIIDQPWADDYQQQLDRFWRHHADTWRQLARLSWLDELARQFKRKHLHREGYYLALDALGYAQPPETPEAMLDTGPSRSAQIWLLHLGDEVVPGLFQVRSPLTAHCFIHQPGSGRRPVEYISDNASYMTERLLGELNDSAIHRHWLYHQQPGQIEARLYVGDPMHALQRASQRAAESFTRTGSDAFMWQPARPALALAGAAELWQARPAILDSLPAPMNIATGLMRDWLHKQHGLDLNPRQVFVAWRPGQRRTPLGHVRQAGNRIHTPETRPMNIAKALISRYQAEQPEGYIDEGGKWAIWHDPTGKGQWQADKQLPLSARQLAVHIERTDFLTLVSRRIETFWTQQQAQVEHALRAAMISQAIVALKQGNLQRGGFDRVVEALSDPAASWSVLGFEVQSSFIEGLEQQPCCSLLMLAPAQLKQRVLYQAGQANGFIEFADADQMNRYLLNAMADSDWRTTVMRYVPDRHQQRLDYLFRFWTSQAPLQTPPSILRPWSDILYQPDRHQRHDQSLYEQPLPAGQPFAYMCQTLRANALEHARQQIVTPTQQTLRYWSGQLRHLQWLLAPMSLVLTPAAVAALATELGVLGTEIAMANLPGRRYPEKQQALASLLSFALWRVGPATVRVLDAQRKLLDNGRRVLRTVAQARAPGQRIGGPTMPRQTRLEPFFHNGGLLKRWTFSGPQYGQLPVHVWKLGRKFLLWTSDRGQARTLVVSTHGYYLPWSKTVKIPNGTQIHTYAPHGHILIDPGLHRVVSQRVSPFAISSPAGHTPALPPLVATDKLLAGTSLPGRLKNYTLAKYQSAGAESYDDVGRTVRNSNSGFFSGQLPPTPMDVLTVRNRFGRLPATLDELFGNLFQQGIHYDRILLVHCRCAALQGLIGQAPVYTVPARLPGRPISP
ncbi:hypothetical protein NRB16_03130 [Pseudomonas sp. LJDD11]|uniref:dermonecrotic toxin domain-containing protein n=1 Tax=Pseudomonas sp. LJDD11 TaxID=2931984 RepID=UPI00211C9C6A|nr:DUF6543 domain-containing protein [Pseudomonas sp. LJDD11]MCQ9422521.1 hypothetical protein [Pseudomonas sp. LJDD11]